ncbi:DUF6221 family protein [Amycolatopsis anabasis]|uniref:DUF6221 family protein n=1 Tax=Amycolatopsis anabasis TaxID=1840409 RepID=UPI00131E58E4|nr:DUF6221 family protein [Amycolatopsis anabasis]
MDDLIAFLTARVNERQALIMRAVNKSDAGEALDREEFKMRTEMRVRSLGEVDLEVINQMIHEVEAVRRIYQEHRTTVSDRVPGFPRYGRDYWCEVCHVPGDSAGSNWCLTLRLLALPYADHPDYQKDWRP